MEDQPRGDRNLPVPFEPDFVPDEVPGPGTDAGGRFSMSRRRFLSLLAAGAAVAAADAKITRGQLVRRARRAIAAMVEAPAEAGLVADFVITVERDVDLVTLDFEFFGFTLQPGEPPAIVPNGEESRVVVHVPPQAIGEAVYLETKTLPEGGANVTRLCVDPAPILSDLAEPSRLVFALRPDETIPLKSMTAADLLDWSAWRLQVPRVARVGNIQGDEGPFPIEPPSADQTQIECPYAVYLSPTDAAAFFTRQEPLTSSASVTECWGAVLSGDDRRVVAAYARDYHGSEDATSYKRISYYYEAIIP